MIARGVADPDLVDRIWTTSRLHASRSIFLPDPLIAYCSFTTRTIQWQRNIYR